MSVCVAEVDYRFRKLQAQLEHLEQPVLDVISEETEVPRSERECVLRLRALVQNEDPALEAELESLQAALRTAVGDCGHTEKGVACAALYLQAANALERMQAAPELQWEGLAAFEAAVADIDALLEN